MSVDLNLDVAELIRLNGVLLVPLGIAHSPEFLGQVLVELMVHPRKELGAQLVFHRLLHLDVGAGFELQVFLLGFGRVFGTHGASDVGRVRRVTLD